MSDVRLRPVHADRFRFCGCNCKLVQRCIHPSQDFEPPSGIIKEGIEQEWGSLDDFIAKFNPTTAAVQV